MLSQPHTGITPCPAASFALAMPPSPRLICGENLRAHTHACGTEVAITWTRARHLSGDGDGGIDGVGDDKQHGLGARLGARCHEVPNLDHISQVLDQMSQSIESALCKSDGCCARTSCVFKAEMVRKTGGAHNGSVGVEEVVARHARLARNARRNDHHLHRKHTAHTHTHTSG